MKVVIIGSGNVATVMAAKMQTSGHEIIQVLSRNEESAAKLAFQLHCNYATSAGKLDHTGDLYFIAVSDSALPELANVLSLDQSMVVHTAGSVSKHVLQPVSTNYGVLYPLQSLRKEYMEIQDIPLLVDANSDDSIRSLYDFANTISNHVKIARDEERLKLHVGAIIVNNFSNHLYALTEEYCKKENIDFSILHPLIRETAARLASFSPSGMQTGPAVRNDLTTIAKHLDLLHAYPSLRKLYAAMTDSILAMYRR